MSSILSEIKNTLETSSIKDTVMDMYHIMFNKLNKVKDILSKKEEPEILPKIVKEAAPVKDEGYAPEPSKPKTPKEIVMATLTNVKDIIWEYGYKFIVICFYIYMSSLVANDMIIYAPPIRAFFFLFTLLVTTASSVASFFVAFYFVLRRGYDYYNQNLSSAKDKPPQSFPTIFAILPLTTYYPTSPFIRFFLWAFMYQKSSNPKRIEKENARLEIIMKNYWDDLNESFTYLKKIKDTPPFSELYQNIEKKLTIEGMHPIQKPETVVEKTTEEKEAKEETEAKEEKEKKKETVQFFKPQSAAQANAPPQYNQSNATQSTSAPPVYNQSIPVKAEVVAPVPAQVPAQVKPVQAPPPSYNSRINGQTTPNPTLLPPT